MPGRAPRWNLAQAVKGISQECHLYRRGACTPHLTPRKLVPPPALAGSTPAQTWRTIEVTVHPRRPVASTGPAPRRRGGPTLAVGPGCGRRNTPASAGRTPVSSNSSRAPAEHPRVGGEDSAWMATCWWLSGTPPRRRGGPRPQAGARRYRRNTPASAGRTLPRAGRPTCRAEHPRVGGEDTKGFDPAKKPNGTPPRRRGGPTPVYLARSPVRTPPRRRGGRPVRPLPVRARRNTPASAGRTSSRQGILRPATEHPRVGGEDPSARRITRSMDGTPPRGRGGLTGGKGRPVGVRNTPASAGRTARTRPRRCACPEHFRVGGEDNLGMAILAHLDGTPPRRRGGPSRSMSPGVIQRNTPGGGEDRSLHGGCPFGLGTPPRRRGGPRV